MNTLQQFEKSKENAIEAMIQITFKSVSTYCAVPNLQVNSEAFSSVIE